MELQAKSGTLRQLIPFATPKKKFPRKTVSKDAKESAKTTMAKNKSSSSSNANQLQKMSTIF